MGPTGQTGDCINLRTAECDLTEAVEEKEGWCYENDELWGICPYCRAYKHHTDHGGELSLGLYVSGEGVFDTDPMKFEGGSDTNCGGVERTADAYWYCWYDANPTDIVPLDHVYTLWLEDPLCHYVAYIYTPLACDWALPHHDHGAG